ncbi:MAG: CDP-diacylglycerol O-phosphatidyltransferase [Ardenticatenaceae bacterium]|nr:hypothetical protein [Anaerolineales bacterium]MCB8923589.1 CDP-diacylglycerol O-phosphatidyltransferase [Ardenticatenaceae bacterium]MCB9003529.1 CDP-diacylglycerol O-phosphatidyltransferase [Ardenticatenaceae bacterium]
MNQFSRKQKGLAWGVHLFTASGAVMALLATFAIFEGRWQAAFGWMATAVMVDALDGTLARWLGVKGALPSFDGALLDNIIDYQTYVIIPALFVVQAELLPSGWALTGASLIVLTSAYQFAQADAKTADHFFKGFPSYWNVVAVYLFLLGLNPVLNLLLIALCAALVFVPLKYVYPSRTETFRQMTLILSSLWGVAILVALVQYPLVQPWLVHGSLLFIAYYLLLSVYLTRTWRRSLPLPLDD